MRTEEKKRHKQKPNSKIVNLLTTISITTFDVKGLNNPIKRLLLLLSRFSRVWLCATPETAAHQATPSLGFSRQEHWSGLPLPSPIKRQRLLKRIKRQDPTIWYLQELHFNRLKVNKWHKTYYTNNKLLRLELLQCCA